MKDKTLKIIALISLILIIAMMAMIFAFSNQTGNKSGELSGRVTEFVINTFYKNYESLSSSEQAALKGNIEHFIRKAAHFTLFMVLGIVLLIHVFSIFELKKKRSIYSIPIVSVLGILYAFSDEFHQFFKEGRGPQFKDVLIDSLGVLTGVLISYMLLTVIKLCIIKKNSKGNIEDGKRED